MAFAALNCPLVQQLVQAIQKDYNLVDDLTVKYLGVPVRSTDDQSPVVPVPVPVQSPGTVTPPPKKSPKKKVVPKESCGGKTAKGEACKFAVKCDGLCGIHLRQAQKVVTPEGSTDVKKSTVSKKKKADAPKHSHVPEEVDPTCGLCEDQGNVVEPELTKAEFEAVEEEGQSIQDRLRAILENADEDPEDQEEAEEPEEPVKESPLESMGDLMAALEPEAESAESISTRAKLAQLIAEEDSDSEVDEDTIEQMSETPPSQAKLKAFEELLEEMES